MTKIARYLFGKELAEKISTRTIDEQHWYTALDICGILGIENHSQAVHRPRQVDEFTLNESEWKKVNIFNGKNKRQMLMVNDNGMLKLIMQGTSPFAWEAQARARNTPQHLVPTGWQQELLQASNHNN